MGEMRTPETAFGWRPNICITHKHVDNADFTRLNPSFFVLLASVSLVGTFQPVKRTKAKRKKQKPQQKVRSSKDCVLSRPNTAAQLHKKLPLDSERIQNFTILWVCKENADTLVHKQWKRVFRKIRWIDERDKKEQNIAVNLIHGQHQTKCRETELHTHTVWLVQFLCQKSILFQQDRCSNELKNHLKTRIAWCPNE